LAAFSEFREANRRSAALPSFVIELKAPASICQVQATPRLIPALLTTRAERKLPLKKTSRSSGVICICGNIRSAPLADRLRMVQVITDCRSLKAMLADFRVRFRGALRFSEYGWVTRDNKRAFISIALSAPLAVYRLENRRRFVWVAFHKPHLFVEEGFALSCLRTGV
jgi:hypothetical protein